MSFGPTKGREKGSFLCSFRGCFGSFLLCSCLLRLQSGFLSGCRSHCRCGFLLLGLFLPLLLPRFLWRFFGGIFLLLRLLVRSAFAHRLLHFAHPSARIFALLFDAVLQLDHADPRARQALQLDEALLALGAVFVQRIPVVLPQLRVNLKCGKETGQRPSHDNPDVDMLLMEVLL